MPTPEIVFRSQPEILYASARFVGSHAELPERLDSIGVQVGRALAGDPIAILHGGVGDDAFEFEVGYPVSWAIDDGGVFTRRLPAGEWIGLIHRGLLDKVMDAWRELYRYVGEQWVGLAEGPGREVLRSLPDDPDGEWIIEVQDRLLMPLWKQRLAAGLERHASAQARCRVMDGSHTITPQSTPAAKSAWARKTMERLEAVVPEPDARHRIMEGCAHVFPQARIDHLRRRYLALGGVDALLAEMGADSSFAGRSFYAAPYRDGQTIITIKVPWYPAGYERAASGAERRANRCHCALVRHAILSGETMSETYCYCGTGWFSRLWSGILGEPVRVDVLRSVLQGDDDCAFAVHLPESALL